MVSKVQSLKLDTSVWSNEIVQVKRTGTRISLGSSFGVQRAAVTNVTGYVKLFLSFSPFFSLFLIALHHVGK